MCTVPRLSDLDLKGVDTVAVDLETYDPELIKKGSGAIKKIGFVCGIAIATKKQTLYFPINHAHTDNLNPDNTWRSLIKNSFKTRIYVKFFIMQCMTCVGFVRNQDLCLKDLYSIPWLLPQLLMKIE